LYKLRFVSFIINEHDDDEEEEEEEEDDDDDDNDDDDACVWVQTLATSSTSCATLLYFLTSFLVTIFTYNAKSIIVPRSSVGVRVGKQPTHFETVQGPGHTVGQGLSAKSRPLDIFYPGLTCQSWWPSTVQGAHQAMLRSHIPSRHRFQLVQTVQCRPNAIITHSKLGRNLSAKYTVQSEHKAGSFCKIQIIHPVSSHFYITIQVSPT